MKRIILYHPRTLHERNYRYFYIPYSVLSIAAAIDRETYEVVIIDNNVLTASEPNLELLGKSEDLLCVGISAMIGHQIRDGFAFAETVRRMEPSIPIVWGGPLATMLPRETLSDPRVDFIVRGQGEIPFRTLVDQLARGAAAPQVAGLGQKNDGGLTLTDPGDLIDLNGMPPYCSVYDLIDFAAYIRPDEHINTRTVSYHSSQGCPFECGFCCEPVLWNRRWKALTPDRMLGDIEWFVARYSINGVKFYDSEFFVDHRRVFEFAGALLQRRMNIRWAASVHPINLHRVTDPELRLLARSGLSRLLIGAESGVQEELDLIRKKTSREMVVSLAQRCSDVGVVASFTFVTGYPGFPATHIERTLEFAQELRQVDANHEAKVHLYGPYPGTPLYPRALKAGFCPPTTLEDWSHFDYYDIETPWVPVEYEARVRAFNETHYPYMHPGVPAMSATPRE